jgi:NAD(P)-dependent dehydrogenase (short-subunit alcohol dehydrogenase family)
MSCAQTLEGKMTDTKRIENKWALVTGSSRGIGQQIVLGLARLKCNVIVHGRTEANVADTLERLNGYDIQTRIVCGELDSEQSVNEFIGRLGAETGGVDILYNNAAIQGPWTELWETPQELWERTFQVNLFSMIALCRAFAPDMKRRGFGRIINLSSGIRDIPQLAPYSVSKAAVDKYSRDLAAELRGTNVLVNYLDPGWLKTDLGGPEADFEVETVMPGALVPALLEDHGPTGQLFLAQEYRNLEC